MKIIREFVTKEVLYCLDDSIEIVFNEAYLHIDTMRDSFTNSTNSELLENIPTPPDTFLGRAYIYDTEWHIIDQEAINAFKLINRPPVPQVITPRQFRLQLLALNLLDEVEAMASVDKATQIWFEYSLDFQRNHEMLLASASALGMSDEDMDTFFIEASKL